MRWDAAGCVGTRCVPTAALNTNKRAVPMYQPAGAARGRSSDAGGPGQATTGWREEAVRQTRARSSRWRTKSVRARHWGVLVTAIRHVCFGQPFPCACLPASVSRRPVRVSCRSLQAVASRPPDWAASDWTGGRAESGLRGERWRRAEGSAARCAGLASPANQRAPGTGRAGSPRGKRQQHRLHSARPSFSVHGRARLVPSTPRL
jgi:hypothetical protein